MKISYHKELDGVRAIAALMVMVFHFFQHIQTTNPMLQMIRKFAFFGQTGVSLFFVLSGFLITRILLSTKNDAQYFSNFYIRRSLRIFPLYYFYLVLAFFLLPLIEYRDIPPFSEQIYHWLYLQDFAMTFNWNYQGPFHFWSLAVEEHYYLFFPLLVYWCNERQILRAIYIIFITSLLVRVCLVYFNYETFFFTFSRMDELAIGALLALLERRNKLTQENNKRFIFLFILTAIPTVLIWTIYSGKAVGSIQVFKYVLISISYFCAIGFVLTVSNHHNVKRFLTLKPLLFTGRISYGLYVYHSLCFIYFARYVHSFGVVADFIGSFILAYLISSLSFYLFENRFLGLKSKYSYKNKLAKKEEDIESGMQTS